METKTWTTVDRSEWNSGPWDGEPDKTQWTDAATGLPCIARRGGGGAWCGYVGVPEGHPWHGKDYCDIETAPDVHGGVTFMGPCHEEGDEATSICHVPEAGEPDNVWWLGFDCGHHADLTPAYSSNLLRDLFDSREASGAAYRTLDYVKAECASLARQAVDAETETAVHGLLADLGQRARDAKGATR